MAVYKQSIDFSPKPTVEDSEEKYKVSKAGVYSAILPFFASLIWVVALLIGVYYKDKVKELDTVIAQKEQEIATYNPTREKHTELVLKVEALKDVVTKDFDPQRFFDTVESTIKKTGGAYAGVYAYERDESGKFVISGRAQSYLDLAKIMVAFNKHKGFNDVGIRSIYYDKKVNNVNFEVSFYYSEVEL